MAKLLVLVALASACVSSRSTECATGEWCPEGTVCRHIELAPTQTVCARPDDLTACDGKPDYASCDSQTDGRCYSGVCQPGGCGNGRVDLSVEGDVVAVAETCDDGNRVPGDGCSADCRSNETCTNGVVDLVTGEQCDDGNAVSHDGCSSGCARETASWSSPVQDFVSDRYAYALAYDARRERVVLFGGKAVPMFGGLFSDTLEWDGYRWHAIPTVVAPSERAYAAMAYDAARERIVLFGGVSPSGTVLGDTWEWDGARWQPIAIAGPSPAPRAQHAMAYDPTRRRVVLTGGAHTGRGERMSTWEWDGVAWTERQTPDAPSRRHGHAMAFDPTRGVMVLFGGLATDPPLGCRPVGDTWELDATNWTSRPISGPPPRTLHAMTTDPSTGHVYLSGGTTLTESCDVTMYAPPGTSHLADAWSYEGTTWAPAASIGYATSSHRIAPLPSGRLVTVAAYRDAGVDRAGTFERSAAGWTIRERFTEIGPPSPRTGMAASYDPVRDRVVMFGGLVPSFSNETFIWNQRWEAGPVTPAPSPRTGAAMTFDEERGEHVLFGGAGQGGTVGDTWRFRDGWTSSSAQLPAARTDAAMGYDLLSKRVILFGGATNIASPTVYLADTWTWDGTTWSPYTGNGPSARTSAKMAFDRRRNRLVLFGGFFESAVTSTFLDDTWEWDGTQWVAMSPAVRPPGRRFHGMAYDHARQRVVLFGGTDSLGPQGSLADAWEWDGTQWTLLPVTGSPARRYIHAMTIAPGGSGVLVFGGVANNQFSRDLLVLRHTAGETVERCGRNDTDGDARIGCDDPDCWLVCAACGDGTCAGPEACTSCPADCGACATECGDLVCDGSEICLGDCPPAGP